jgi:RNA 2',3'-cyclic 3'-phosphodiesterase
MRLFIAADLDTRARAEVVAAVRRLRDQSERDRSGSTRGASWVGAQNLHLTLHFLGEVEEARLASLQGALAPALDIAPPRIGLGPWGVFPPAGSPRVIWAAITSGTAELAHAHEVIGSRLRAAGIATEARPFSPHLTIARVRVPSGTHWQRMIAAAPSDLACEWTLDACTLYQSHLSPAGSAYAALLRIPFGSAPRPSVSVVPEGHHAG